MLDGDEQLQRTLVPLIPAAAMVNITGVTSACDTDDSDSWMMQDLRQELLLIAHGLQSPHANMVDTCRNVRRMANWYKMERSVEQYWLACPECIAKHAKHREITQALWGQHRFATLVIDKLVLKDVWKEVVGAPAVLIVTAHHQHELRGAIRPLG